VTNIGIGEYDNKIPSDLTAEQILIRSGNIGSIRIAQLVGPEKHKSFLKKIGVLSSIDFDIDEIAPQKDYNFGKCRLATASFGHGVATTILQLAKGYAVISNGGYDIKPSLIKKTTKTKEKKSRLINKEVSDQVVTTLKKNCKYRRGYRKIC
jgi:cell division protein FtsI (penicillin-binding protein 3)